MLRRLRLLPAALLLGAACTDSGITAPQDDRLPATEGSVFSESITLPQLQAAVTSGAVRVQVKLRSAEAPLVAKEIEREGAEDLLEEEKLESRATAVGTASVTLELGGLQVGFGAGTRFRAEGGDTLTQQEFAARVTAALAAGTRPGIEAKRAAPAAPQAPGDATFVASVIELDDEAGEPKLEMNADADNLVVNAADASAVLTLLGLPIRISVSETQIEKTRPEKKAKAKFEGLVRTVDLTAGTLTLVDGRVIRVVSSTEIEAGKGRLASLAEAAAALTAHKIVEAEGRGIAEGGTPATLLAAELKLKVQHEAENVPESHHLKGAVASVDTVARTVTLAGGQVLRLVQGTHWQQSHELSSLGAVAAALLAKQAVSLDAKVVLEAAGPPPSYVALKVKFKDETKKEHDDGDAAGATKFDGRVASVAADNGSFTLAGGKVIRLAPTTKIDPKGDLQTMSAVIAALAAGKVVEAEGKGANVGHGETTVFVVATVKFEIGEDDDEAGEGKETKSIEFESKVSSVDVAAKRFTLTDGTIVRLTDTTKVQGDVTTLQQVADALAAGKVVEVEGRASLESAGPPRVLVAEKVDFEVD